MHMETDTVVWPESPDRDQWWRTVLGVGTEIRECAAADLLDQQRAEPVDDDLYPHVPREPVAA
jgi:hypothetical protein